MSHRLTGLAWAGAAELAWHLLGPAWAFAVLTVAVGWTATRIPAIMTKAYAVETRVDALVPAVHDAKTAAASASSAASSAASAASSAQSTATTALNTIPANHSFLGGLSKGSSPSGPGAAAGGVPGVGANVAGGVPSVYASVSGSCSVNPASQGYVNALAGNVNDLRADVINLAYYVDALRTGCYNDLRDDVVSLRTYVTQFAGTYNSTVNAVNSTQDQLSAHGYTN